MSKINGVKNTEQDRRIQEIEKDKEILKRDFYGHMTKFNGEMGDVRQNVAQIKTDVDWLKKTYWIISTASIGGLIAGLVNLLIKNK